jgi:hypothetical protein
MVIKLGTLVIAFVIAWTVLQPLHTDGVLADQTAGAVLKITVFDQYGAVIPLPEGSIIVENLETKQVWKVGTDDAGSSSATVPAGTYRITSDAPIYLPFRRADFHLESGSTSMVNLVLHPEYLVRGTAVGREKVDELGPKPQFDSFTIPGARSDISKALIRYFGKRTANGKTVYKYAALTFDLITVYADEISRDGKTFSFNASERVIVEDGKARENVNAAEIEFKDGKAIIKRVN